MDDSASDNPSESAGGTEYTARRVPDPLEGDESPPNNDGEATQSPDQPGEELQPDEGNTTANTDVPPTTDTEIKSAASAVEPQRERILKLLGGKLTLNTYQHPIIGSPEAPHVVVEMVSYDCPHCRKLHPLLHKALERYGDQLAVVVMPFPFDTTCNKRWTGENHVGACGTVRRACGVARLNPRAFVKFHDFLMSGGDEPPTMERIVPKANGLVNRDQLRQLIGSPEITKQIDGYMDLFYQLASQSRDPKTFGFPIQIVGDHVMSASVEKPEDLYKAWEENLGVKPK
jgi:thiol-disulfide isomerase/thioredoxin